MTSVSLTPTCAQPQPRPQSCPQPSLSLPATQLRGSGSSKFVRARYAWYSAVVPHRSVACFSCSGTPLPNSSSDITNSGLAAAAASCAPRRPPAQKTQTPHLRGQGLHHPVEMGREQALCGKTIKRCTRVCVCVCAHACMHALCIRARLRTTQPSLQHSWGSATATRARCQ